MIDRQFGRIIIECDSCNETFKGGKDDEFQTVWSEAKAAGWSTRKIADEWLHGCPTCGRPT